jgi:hypothetical protein
MARRDVLGRSLRNSTGRETAEKQNGERDAGRFHSDLSIILRTLSKLCGLLVTGFQMLLECFNFADRG